MIVRSLLLRHGRRAIPKPIHPPCRPRQWRRFLATSIEQNDSINADSAQLPIESHDLLSSTHVDPSQENDPIKADWEFYLHQRSILKQVGADVEPHYKPHQLIANPPKPQDITLELLLASQTHLGHRTSLWNPGNSRYIFGVWGQAHEAIHVISLDVTAAHLRRACRIVSGVAARGGLILFVGTRDGHTAPVVRAAELAKGCHLFDKWTPGTLTNAQQILGKCATKVVNHLDEDVPGFEPQLGERAVIKPDLVVCLNPLENYVLLHECGMHNIPTVGIIDTDANPTWVTYPIPANDDSLRSVALIAGVLGRAGQEGQQIRMARARQRHVDYTPAQNLRLPTKQEIADSKRGDTRFAEEEEEEDEMDEEDGEEEHDEGQPDAYAKAIGEGASEVQKSESAADTSAQAPVEVSEDKPTGPVDGAFNELGEAIEEEASEVAETESAIDTPAQAQAQAQAAEESVTKAPKANSTLDAYGDVYGEVTEAQEDEAPRLSEDELALLAERAGYEDPNGKYGKDVEASQSEEDKDADVESSKEGERVNEKAHTGKEDVAGGSEGEKKSK